MWLLNAQLHKYAWHYRDSHKHVWAFQWTITVAEIKQVLAELSQAPDANLWCLYTDLSPRSQLSGETDNGHEAASYGLAQRHSWPVLTAWYTWHSQVSERVTSAHWHPRASRGGGGGRGHILVPNISLGRSFSVQLEKSRNTVRVQGPCLSE